MWGRKKIRSVRQYHFLGRTKSKINSVALKVSIWLSSKTAHLSKKKLFLYFLICGFLFLAYNIYLVVKGIREYGTRTDTLVVNVHPLRTDSIHHYYKHNALPVFDSTSFNKYFDSISSNSVIMDSLKKYRPGLIDSLLIIQRYYRKETHPQ
jgi:hypothetical protein